MVFRLRIVTPNFAIFTLAALLIVVLAQTGFAQDASRSQLNGRTIEYVVGSKPGGGYDRTARLIAPFLEKHLPGAKIVVKNDSRAGGISSLNKLAVVKGNGTLVMTPNTGFLISQIGNGPGLTADLAELNWIGKATSEARFIVISESSGVKSIQDLLDRPEPAIFGGQSHGSAGYVQSVLLRDIFGMNIRILAGFGGSEAIAAMAKGEIDGDIVSESNVRKVLKAKAGFPIARFGVPQDPKYNEVPDLSALIKNPSQELVVRQFETLTQLGRLTVTATDTPPEVVTLLRNAYAKTMTDPEFLEEAARQNVIIDHLHGSDVQNLVQSFLTSSPEFSELVRGTLEQ